MQSITQEPSEVSKITRKLKGGGIRRKITSETMDMFVRALGNKLSIISLSDSIKFTNPPSPVLFINSFSTLLNIDLPQEEIARNLFYDSFCDKFYE